MASARTTEEWPRLVWFLRSRMMSRVVFIVCILALVTESFTLAFAGERPLGYLGVVLGAAGVVLAWYRPFTGLLVVTAGAVSAALLASEFVGLWTIVVLQLFSVTIRGTRAVAAFVVAAVPVFFAVVVREGWNFQAPMALIASACCAAAAGIGGAICAQERYLASIRQRAIDAESAAELAIERGVAEERLRIARDLHDAVGHEVAVVSMSLGVAEVHLGAADVEARAALQAARGGVQRVLLETQQILDILRRGRSDAEDNAPVADIAQIPDLVKGLELAGTPITAELGELGDLGELEPAVGVAAFRIVQEALTNAQRYGLGTIRLSVSRLGDAVVVDVWNARSPADARSTFGSGYGLIGMRERAESVGGTLEVIEEPAAFGVRAVLGVRGDAER